MNHLPSDLRFPVRCFRCSEGCIHLEYGNALFTFTPQQFRVLAEVIVEAYRRVQCDAAPDVDEFPESLMM
jgi:hypothetical protein